MPAPARPYGLAPADGPGPRCLRPMMAGVGRSLNGREPVQASASWRHRLSGRVRGATARRPFGDRVSTGREPRAGSSNARRQPSLEAGSASGFQMGLGSDDDKTRTGRSSARRVGRSGNPHVPDVPDAWFKSSGGGSAISVPTPPDDQRRRFRRRLAALSFGASGSVEPGNFGGLGTGASCRGGRPRRSPGAAAQPIRKGPPANPVRSPRACRPPPRIGVERHLDHGPARRRPSWTRSFRSRRSADPCRGARARPVSTSVRDGRQRVDVGRRAPLVPALRSGDTYADGPARANRRARAPAPRQAPHVGSPGVTMMSRGCSDAVMQRRRGPPRRGRRPFVRDSA